MLKGLILKTNIYILYMTTIDTDISNYTLAELMAIVDISDLDT